MNQAIPLRTLHPEMPYDTAMREVLAAHYAAVQIFAAFLDQPDHAHEHHQLRIAAKRLRYSLEMCQDLFPDATAAGITELKNLQNALGALHDLDIMFVAIEDTLTATPPPRHGKPSEQTLAKRRTSFEALLSTIAAERDTQYQRCLALWNDMVAREALTPVRQVIRQ